MRPSAPGHKQPALQWPEKPEECEVATAVHVVVDVVGDSTSLCRCRRFAPPLRVVEAFRDHRVAPIGSHVQRRARVRGRLGREDARRGRDQERAADAVAFDVEVEDSLCVCVCVCVCVWSTVYSGGAATTRRRRAHMCVWV